MLVGSVVLPAGQSRRVLALLDDDERLIDPLRRLSSQLSSGIAEESAEQQRFAISGDSAAFVRYQRARSRNDERAEQIEQLSARAGGQIAADADSLRGLVTRWRRVGTVGPAMRSPLTTVRAAGAQREAARDSIVLSIARLDSVLAAQSTARRAAVRAHETRGIAINAAQVLIALFVLAALFEVLRRERRRARRDAAMRRIAASLARAFNKQDVARHLANGAVELLAAARASVVHIDATAEGVRLTVAASSGAVDDSTAEGVGADAEAQIEQVIRTGHPSIAMAATSEDGIPRHRRVMLIPLGAPDSPIGAVVAFESAHARFHRRDLAWAAIFGHLASLAYEKVRLLEEARAGQARLQRVIESRGRLIRGFSHDVKNPLGAADGYAALLQDGIYGPVSDEQVSSIGRLREAIHRALSLIEDLHELARAETGHLDIHVERVGVADLVSEIADEYRAAARAKHLDFTVEIELELPQIETDPSRARQIIGNLLSNAIKYTDSGTVTLRARSEAADAPSDRSAVLIEVVDTGPGIPLEDQDFIFDEFARIADGKHPGVGLGLAISKHVADALGCRLTVSSIVGKGATFTLRLPTRTEAADAPPKRTISA